MSERMLAFGLSGSTFEYEDRPLQRRRSLEDKWYRERKLIAAKFRGVSDLPNVYTVNDAHLVAAHIVLDVWSEFEEEVQSVPQAEAHISASPQMELWNDTSFSPSATLLELWKSGISFYLKAARQDEVNVLAGSTFSQTMRSEFSDQLVGAVISQLRSLRGPEPLVVKLVSRQGDLEPRLEIMLSNLFPVKPSEISLFLKQLSVEIIQHFDNGFQLAGEWGKVTIQNGEVIALLSAVSLPVYVKANKRAVDIDL